MQTVIFHAETIGKRYSIEVRRTESGYRVRECCHGEVQALWDGGTTLEEAAARLRKALRTASWDNINYRLDRATDTHNLLGAAWVAWLTKQRRTG